MQQKVKHEATSGDSSTSTPLDANARNTNVSKKGHGYYAINLAFNYEDESHLESRSALDVYAQLSHPLVKTTGVNLDESESVQTTNVFFANIWRTAVAGCLLAVSIILMYLWIHVKFIHPMVTEVFRVNASSSQSPIIPRITHIHIPRLPISTWKVEADTPPGIPLVKTSARDLSNPRAMSCPVGKFALALYIESDAKLAETWLRICGKNVAYFRIDGHPTDEDVEKLLGYLKYADAQYLPLKVKVNVEKGASLLDNPDYKSTIMSDEIIRIVNMSGYVSPKTVEELIEAAPYAEEVVIDGREVCETLRPSPQITPAACQVTWKELQTLHIVGTDECRGLYDLIYSCWSMPNIKVLQIRNSIISGPNSNYIKGILDRNRITKVDFADNSCFDDTLENYPFMCQSSGYADYY